MAPSIILGTKPKSCMCIALKIKADTQIAICWFFVHLCRVLCKTPLNKNSSPIPGSTAIATKPISDRNSHKANNSNRIPMLAMIQIVVFTIAKHIASLGSKKQ